MFFNRDEKKTRSVAEPPRLHEGRERRFLAPIDPDGGGTWMVANDAGLVVCLLNRWHEEPMERPRRSRGRLVFDLAEAANLADLGERLKREDLSRTAPFTLVGLQHAGESAWIWNGAELSLDSPTMPLTSSSFRFPDVAQARRERFAELQRSEDSPRQHLTAYHGMEGEEASAFTVRMLRPDARTMSRSRLTVGRDEVQWEYLEEPDELVGSPRTIAASMPLSSLSGLHA